jgi:drug/metabolite transporter (DMT)-like permease
MLLATFWFALMNLAVKKLAHLPTMELVFFRCGIASVIGLFALRKEGVAWWGVNRRLLFLRGTFGTIALFSFFYTLQRMPMGTAVTIQYLSPIFTAIFAIFIVNERVRLLQWFWFLLSFLGVLMIKGFSDGVSWTLLGIGIGSAVFSALAYNMVRILKEKEHPLVVVLHFQLIGALAGGVSLFWLWTTPAWSDLPYILLMGLFTQWGQDNLTRSLQSERIAKVTVLNYLGVVYALLLGFLFFGETPNWKDLAGILLVLAGVVLNILISPNVQAVQSSGKAADSD